MSSNIVGALEASRDELADLRARIVDLEAALRLARSVLNRHGWELELVDQALGMPLASEEGK